MIGSLGILVGNARKWACVSLSIRLHDGFPITHDGKGTSISLAVYVLKIVEDTYHTTQIFGDCLLLLERHFPIFSLFII